MSLLDDVMPDYAVHEVHSLRVPAAPGETYDAMKAVTAGEVRLFGSLMWLRTVGRSKRVFDPQAPLLDEMAKIGFTPLAERPGNEIVIGAIGRFWSPTGTRPPGSPDFATFAEPGYARAAVNFRVTPERDGSRITTETRIIGTDVEATRKFRRYWLVVRPGSGAIRRSWLKAIRRRAETR